MAERPGGSTGPRRVPDRSGSPSGRPGSEHGELAGLGLAMGLTIVAFALGGNWLDGRLGTKPLFVLVGVFVGFAGGFYSLYARLVLRRRGETGEENGDG